MSIEKNKLNAWILNKKDLEDKLAIEIARKFWMEKNKALLLLKTDISKWLEELKKEINKQEDEKLKKFENKKLEDLFFTIKWALEIIEKISQIEIKILKDDIEWNYIEQNNEWKINISDFKNYIEDYLPPKLLIKAKNPNAIHEHILGFALWTTNSIIKTVEILYKIWKWILTTPIDLYMIITWKAKTDSFKNI